jgi:hypothetical protein
LEDTFLENILYAGTIRGVFVSTNRGASWSYFGTNMPVTAIADLEINENTHDLIVGTHGRGIYKVNLKPMYEMAKSGWSEQEKLFAIPQAQLPWNNSMGGETDYRTHEKLPITFSLTEPQRVTLSITDETGKQLWKHDIDGKKGLNQFRWDLITERVTSSYAYFIHYDKFLNEGSYQLKLSTKGNVLTQLLVAVKGESPYKR